jgi:hypothetical protein
LQIGRNNLSERSKRANKASWGANLRNPGTPDKRRNGVSRFRRGGANAEFFPRNNR